MPYLHVFLSVEPEPDKERCVLRDLGEAELKSLFVRPFKSGKNLLCGNEIIPHHKIRRITIIATDEKSDAVLVKAQNASNEAIAKLNNESSSIVFLGGLGYDVDDLVSMGNNVTAKYITTLPDRIPMNKFFVRLLNNPWVVGVGGGVVVAAIAGFLKLS